jgi:dTDP-glucose 4,6-dehydratase
VRLLVTGGAGFIGANFVRRTLAERPEMKITVLDSLTYAGRLANLGSVLDEAKFHQGDIRDEELVNQLVAETDAIVHFAAETHNDNSLHSPEIFFETNVMGTVVVAQAAVRRGVRLHHVSTDEVFGDLPIDSKTKFHRESAYRPSSPYSASKAASDHLIRAWVRSFGLRATISNCSNNYGPFQHEEKLIPATIKSIAAGQAPKVYGTGNNVRDWIHVDDHTDGILAILDRGQIGETYLLGSNGERSNLQLVQEILVAMGKPKDFIDFVSDRPGHDLRYAIDASQTANELGWAPIKGEIEAHLADLIAHYSQPTAHDFESIGLV